MVILIRLSTIRIQIPDACLIVNPSFRYCCKQMKCPVAIANELSDIGNMGYKEARRLRRFAYEYV
ncbi:MAG: hypothetical protein LWW97_05615, partial [Deltaproteobacteria bacterium]|nr:hypothetical protein [Deltaproteobacteria bacterium]